MAESSFDATVKNSKRNKRKSAVIALICICLVVSAGLLYCMSELFFVKKILIKNITEGSETVEFPYTDEEMLTGLGIKKGDELYGFNTKEAQNSAVYNLAYIKEIKLSRRWPSTVVAKVELENAEFYVSVSGDLYILSENLKVLEKTSDAEKIEMYNLILLETGKVDHCIVGEKLGVGDDVADIIRDITKELSEKSLLGNISVIDVKDKFNIKLMYSSVYEVILGDSKSLKTKVDFMNRIIADRGENTAGGTIDVSDAEKREAVYKKFS